MFFNKSLLIQTFSWCIPVYTTHKVLKVVSTINCLNDLFFDDVKQQSPNFLAQGMGFMEDSFSMDEGSGRWFQDDSSALYLLY